MPAFKKRALSLFLRNGCERQFVLYLYTDTERTRLAMPSRQRRAGLGIVGQAGYEWQSEKVRELKDIFGAAQVHEDPLATVSNPGSVRLTDILPRAAPYQFIVEGEYNADTQAFRNAVGLSQLTDFYRQEVGIGDTRPDIIQILPSMAQGGAPQSEKEPNPYEMEVLPSGYLEPLAPDDTRLRLRIIDIKLTAEPGANYFAEVVYYSMTLSAWLEETGFADNFVVVGAPAVWPGSHDASHLAEHRSEWQRQAHTPTPQELVDALEEDLEFAIFDVFAPRLRSFLTEELPELLSKSWDELAWHVDHRCKGCEFLSAALNPNNAEDGEDLRCYPTAEQQRALSRVSGLSRGASNLLRNNNVSTVEELAALDSASEIFDQHQGLRSKRTSFPHRAIALSNGTTSIIPESGGDALMPKWPSLRIFLFLDYDLSSAITVSMAIRASWQETLPFGSLLDRQSRQWTERNGDDEIFLVDTRTIDRERQEFLRFLRQLSRIITDVRNQDDLDNSNGRRNRSTARSTYQIYLWDNSQKKHLMRLIGRHLPHILADTALRELAWLFPPPELLQDAAEATRSSALTLLKTVVENTVAIDVPHYYGLLDLAERVKPAHMPSLSIHPLYQELFSDLIPMERLHELWNRRGQWLTTQQRIVQASRTKVLAVNYVAGWLQNQLRNVLTNLAAPPVTPLVRSVGGIAPMSRLWLGFTKLNAALDSLETHSTRAMPPHERVARFKSARLRTRLAGTNRTAAIQLLNTADEINLVDRTTLLIYELYPDSTDINIQRGEFLYALAPQNDHGFLDRNAYSLTSGTPFERNSHYQQTAETAGLTSVTVESIDRINGLIALTVDNIDLITIWERAGRFDFSQNVMLDPVQGDYLTKKVELTLRAIGHPSSAPTDPRTVQALGLRQIRQGRTQETPPSEILWNAPAVVQQGTNINLGVIRPQFVAFLAQQQEFLDDSQWRAWTQALEHRLSLIWGPPGTGKSRTLRAIALGALLDAKVRQQPLRLLISSNTYTAIDNVLLRLESELRNLLGEDSYRIYRIQSSFRDTPSTTWAQEYPSLRNVIYERFAPSDEVLDLRESLENPDSIIVVGCHPQQLHNLAIGADRDPAARLTMRRWFDFLIIDEASQIDVATSTLILSKRATDGICVIAGDDLQLPPIHKAEPPQDLENSVQSLYGYFRHFHAIEPVSLDVNYRSNRTIVEFTRMAGYSENLRSFSPDLKLNFVVPIADDRPSNWPDELYWTPEWKTFLDPEYPAISFVYRDQLSAQTNDFEADSVAALIWLLRNRLAHQLLNQLNSDGTLQQNSNVPYQINQFWQHAVGVVTPHRAQRSKVITRLRNVFPNDPTEDIFGAVDTVERYQGQQRDVIIASFGIGDPDLIESEDEFLYDLNRFNVLASRARAKVIVFCTYSLLKHLSNDVDVLSESRLLKGYVEAFCQNAQPLQLGFHRNGEVMLRDGMLRRRRIN